MERLISNRVEGWNELGANDEVVTVMDRVCRDDAVARAMERVWKKQFVSVSIPPLP